MTGASWPIPQRRRSATGALRVVPGAATFILVAFGASPAAADPGRRLSVRTLHVEDLAAGDGSLWVATRGGVERYGLGKLQREALYTTGDGLAANFVRRVDFEDGQLRARTNEASCTLRGSRFVCERRERLGPPVPRITPRFHGARVTVQLELDGRRFVGTAGGGLWTGGDPPRRLTPRAQICGNHVMDVASWRGHLWVGSFDRGLCVRREDGGYRSTEAPARMVNALAATPQGLYVGASEGLFRTRDGRRFERVQDVTQRGVNGLAYDGRSLWVTTPGALWRLRPRADAPTRQWWRPGGSSAVQSVAVHEDVVWIATEDRGAIRFADGEFRVFDRAAGMPSSWALDVAVDERGTAWVATLRHGLAAVSPAGAIRNIPLPDRWLLSVRAAEGILWVGSQGGAFRVRADRAHTIGGLPDPRVHVVRPLGDRIVVGTEGGLAELRR